MEFDGKGFRQDAFRRILPEPFFIWLNKKQGDTT